jgi:hypothetical protein
MPLCGRQLPSYKTFKLRLKRVGVTVTKLPHFPLFPLSLNTKISQISINTNNTTKKVHGSSVFNFACMLRPSRPRGANHGGY